LLFLLILGGFAVLFALSVTEAAGEVQQLAGQVAVQDAWQQPEWLAGTAFQEVLDERVPAPSVLFGALTGDQGQLVLPTLFGFTQNIISVVSAALVILFLSIYWTIDQVHFERLWLSLLPVDWRARVRDIWRTTEPELGAYIRNAAIRSVLAGLLLGLGYWALGSPYPTLLALAGALALLIPMVGVALAVIAPLLVGLLTSVQLTLFTVLFAIVVLVALKLWVEPRLFRRGHYNPILTVVILMALANAFGLVGLIVAPPLSVVCQILWSRLVTRRAVSAAAGQISDLKARQVQVRAVVEGMETPPPLVTSSLERLNRLLEQAESTLAVATTR
jgi:predicted PurR-regulated permease PerM